MRQSIAKLSKMPENLRGYQHGKSANQTHEPIKKDVISSWRERLRCWFVSRKYRALMSHAFGVRHTQFNPCTRSNLCRVPIPVLSVLASQNLSTQYVPIQIRRKEVYFKDPDAVLKTG